MRFAALALLILLGTAACAPPPPPGVPTTTPVIEDPVVFTVVLSSSQVGLLDEEGEPVSTFEYADEDATPLVAALNKAFGTEVGPVPQGEDTIYSWNGLQLQDFADADAGTRINVVKPTVEGVDVQAVGGVGIGTPSSTVEEVASSASVESVTGIDIRVFLLDTKDGRSVVLTADEPDGHVYDIVAGGP